MARAIGELDHQVPVAVVHLKKHDVDDSFEVHETTTDPENPDEMFCVSCIVGHAWQLGVCIGARGSKSVRILYPSGSFGSGNYASGYALLLNGVPSGTFSIRSLERPAQLELIDSKKHAYRVSEAMLAAEAARAGGQA